MIIFVFLYVNKKRGKDSHVGNQHMEPGLGPKKKRLKTRTSLNVDLTLDQ